MSLTAAARIELVARRALDERKTAAASLDWYATTLDFARELADRYSLRLSVVVGVIAALSPMQTWEEQLTYTPRVLEAHHDKRPLPGPGVPSNKVKAQRILDGEFVDSVLSGYKVRAFFDCILSAGDTDQVCVDRHAWAIARGLDAVGLDITPKRYRETAAAYVSAAAAIRATYPALSDQLTPARVQSLTWVWWRDNTDKRF